MHISQTDLKPKNVYTVNSSAALTLIYQQPKHAHDKLNTQTY